MELVQWYVKCLKQYADFNGRARRKEYWSFYLVNFIIGFIIGLVGLDVLSYIYSLAILVPSIAVGVRRLHDINKPTWFIILAFIPIVNFYYLYLTILDSTPGTNAYGPNPKGL